MKKQWRVTPMDVELVDGLARHCNIPHFLAQLLLRRGIQDPAAVQSFLDPKLTDLRDPELLPGVAKAADCLYEAVRSQKAIVIYGDYDADGMTSTAILLGALRLMGANVTYHVPNRLEDGYGLNAAAITKLAELGKQTIVTVDCGIASVAETALAKQLGMQVIITDHHQMGSVLPDGRHRASCLADSSIPFSWTMWSRSRLQACVALCQRASQAKRVSPSFATT